MGRHSSTSGDPPGNNGVIGRGYPIAGTEEIGHIIAVMQHRQVRLSVSLKLTTFRYPVYHRSNVFNSMYVSTWDIPKPPKVISRISASLTMSQEISPLEVTPSCWTPIARKSLRVVGPQSRGPHQKKQGPLLQTAPSAGLKLVGHGPALHKTPRTQETNLKGAMSRAWGGATSEYRRRS